VLAAAYGASSAIFGQIYSSIFAPNTVNFILFMAIALGSITLVGTIFLNYTNKEEVTEIDSKEGVRHLF
jgi:hypothetical protein